MVVKLPSLTATWHNTTYPSISPTLPHLSVAGKSILITGGGRGIGARTAHSFALAGASLIALTGRTLSALESTKASLEAEFPQIKVLITTGDVTDESVMDSAFAALSAANDGNGVDICVHNAGYLPDFNRITEADAVDWWSGCTINILGSFIVTRAFLKYRNVAADADPVLVGISAGAVAFEPEPKTSGYAVSKFGQARFFETVRLEEREKEGGVRVMQVHPGMVVTDMGKKGIEAGVEWPVDDVSLPADFIVWATSQEAAWLQGKLIWCNWDIDELKANKDEILAKEGSLKLGMIGWPFQP